MKKPSASAVTLSPQWYTSYSATLPTSGAPVFLDYLFNELKKMYGGTWDLEADPLYFLVKESHINHRSGWGGQPD